MNRELKDLWRKYQVALRKHLKRGPRAELGLAQGLGRRAMTLGLGTLDLVRIHEGTLIKLVLPSDSPAAREAAIRRAGSFFAEAVTPIEQIHRTARETNARLDQLNDMLRQQSVDLSASNRQLKKEIARRKTAEAALSSSQQHYRELLEQSQRMQEQLRILSRELLLGQEEERKRISRELHDVIAQTLTSINVRLAKLKRGSASNTRGLERNINYTQKLVQHSVNIIHRFARELRPTVLDDLGLIPALHTYMKSFRAETGIRVRLSAAAAIEQLSDDKRTVLYRVAQEALTNIARHAQASEAKVQIQKLDNAVCMTIKDNGKGFDGERVLHAKASKPLGLLGMRERLEMVGGHFTFASRRAKGTTVIARVPLFDRAEGVGPL